MDFQISPKFWWSTGIRTFSHPQYFKREWIRKSFHVDSVKIDPSLLMSISWRERKLESVIWASGDALCRWSSTPGAWGGEAGACPPPWSTSPRTRPQSRASCRWTQGLPENFQKLMKVHWCSGPKPGRCRQWARQMQKKQKFQLTYVGIEDGHNGDYCFLNVNKSLQCQTPNWYFLTFMYEDEYLSTGRFYLVTEKPCWTCNSQTKVDNTMHTMYTLSWIIFHNRHFYQRGCF